MLVRREGDASAVGRNRICSCCGTSNGKVNDWNAPYQPAVHHRLFVEAVHWSPADKGLTDPPALLAESSRFPGFVVCKLVLLPHPSHPLSLRLLPTAPPSAPPVRQSTTGPEASPSSLPLSPRPLRSQLPSPPTPQPAPVRLSFLFDPFNLPHRSSSLPVSSHSLQLCQRPCATNSPTDADACSNSVLRQHPASGPPGDSVDRYRFVVQLASR